MHNNNGANDAQKPKDPLKFIIEDKKFETFDQYKTGAELKILGNIPLDVDLYLKVQKGYDDELIENEKSVDLARKEIEKFYVKEVFNFKLNEKLYRSFKRIVTGKEILEIADFDVRCFTLYQKLKGHDFEKISLDEKVDLSNLGVEHFITKDAETFTYTVNGEHEMTDEKSLTATKILQLDAIDDKVYYLIQVFEDGSLKSYAYLPDEQIQMSCKGLVFITGKWLEIVDVEEYGKQCKEVPPSRKYKIKIDKDYHIVEGRFIAASKLIALGGKSDTAYNVYKFMNGNPKPILILPGETVDLTEKCLVRFVLQPKEQQDGRGNRQSFTLPDEDEETLEKMGLQWETLTQPGMWLVIYDYPIPDGYNVSTATLALRITPSYPATEIDMAYFNPPLSKNNGKGISCATPLAIDGKSFQQWSRHRKPGQWVAGVDNLATHLSLVDNWLTNDLKR